MPSRPTEHADARPLPRWAPLAVVVMGVLAFAVWLARGIVHDPAVVLLLPKGGAQWIKPHTNTTLFMVDPTSITTVFRATFDFAEDTAPPELHVMALRSVHVLLDGTPIHQDPYSREHWKREIAIPLPEHLAPGRHTLLFLVTNDIGPPAIRVRAPELGLYSSTAWDSTTDGRTWEPTEPLSSQDPPWIATTFPTVWHQFLDIASLLASVGLVAAAAT